MQKQMFTWMPVIFTFMLGAFPSGLVIYWTWNNTLSVIQQIADHEAGRRENRTLGQSRRHVPQEGDDAE